MFSDRPNRASEVVFVGRSNVGKSTLLRELTGHDVPTGRKPGVTRQPNFYDWTSHDFLLTDLPGFGFMSGVPSEQREKIKTNIVQYIEQYADQILVAVLVVDGKSALDIIDRHTDQGDIPYDLEMYDFLQDLEIPTVIAVNKIDKVDDVDDRLNELGSRFGLPFPWRQWSDVIAPISAKNSDIDALKQAVREQLHSQKRDDLFRFF